MFQKLSTMEHPNRSLEVLKYLRKSEVGAHGTVTQGCMSYKIHCRIVGMLSPHFYGIFLKNKNPASIPTMEFSMYYPDGEISSAPVEVLLDYAYGSDVVSKLSKLFHTAVQVHHLVHRYGVSQLQRIACEVALKQMSVENCAKLYNWLDKKDVVFPFMLQNAFQVAM